MKKLIISVFTALLCCATVAKEQPPAGGEPKDFTLTETQTLTLENGLKVTFIPYGNTPKVTLRLVSNAGNYFDGNKLGLADISYDLLLEGTENNTAQQIAEQAATMGGQLQTSTGMNDSFVQLDVLSEFVGDAASLMAEVVTRSRFAEDDIQQAVTNMLRQVQVQRSQAQGQANEAFFGALYPNHPYGRVFPSDAELNSITVADVRGFVSTYLVGANSHLYVSGVFNRASAEAAISQAFSALAQGQVANTNGPDTLAKPHFTFVERPEAPQSTLRFGLPVIDPTADDFVPLQAMNSLLGGSFSSRITSNIREDKGYTYSPNSSVQDNVDQATWLQSADVTAEATGPSMYEIIKEIKRLQGEAPSAEELQAIQNYMTGIFVLQNSSRTAIIGQLAYLNRHGLTKARLENYVKVINGLTPEKISALAKQHLDLSKMSLTVVGDPGVKEQLAEVETLKQLYGL